MKLKNGHMSGSRPFPRIISLKNADYYVTKGSPQSKGSLDMEIQEFGGSPRPPAHGSLLTLGGDPKKTRRATLRPLPFLRSPSRQHTLPYRDTPTYRGIPICTALPLRLG